MLPSQFFFSGMEVGEQFVFITNQGKETNIKLAAKGERASDGTVRCFFELNGTQYSLDIVKRKQMAAKSARLKEKKLILVFQDKLDHQ